MKKWNQLLAVLLALSLTAVPTGAVSLRVEGNSANSWDLYCGELHRCWAGDGLRLLYRPDQRR